jgi:nucleoid DNA-binding protein
VLVAAKATPHFKAGKEMRERVEQSVKPEKSSLAW